jgi:hypothetical protein
MASLFYLADMPTHSRERADHSPEHPEFQCTINKVTGVDDQGRPVFGATHEESCIVLKLPGDSTDVSAKFGSSPDSPAPPRLEDAVLLLRITTKAHVGDFIDVAGFRLKAIAISPTYDSVGKLAYHLFQATETESSN